MGWLKLQREGERKRSQQFVTLYEQKSAEHPKLTVGRWHNALHIISRNKRLSPQS
jgi:hypothetical protein